MSKTNLTAWKAPKSTEVVAVLAQNDANMREILSGKTLLEVADELGLNDSDVDFKQTKAGDNIVHSLGLTYNGKLYLVPLSRSFPMDKKADPSYLLNCEFRTGFVFKRNSENEFILDEDGNKLFDETKPYVTFGKPSGITIVGTESIFTEANKTATAGAGQS